MKTQVHDGTITTADLRSSLEGFLNDVEAGQRITITRHGKPKACLVPIEDVELLRRIEGKIDAALGKLALEEIQTHGDIRLEEARARRRA